MIARKCPDCDATLVLVQRIINKDEPLDKYINIFDTFMCLSCGWIFEEWSTNIHRSELKKISLDYFLREVYDRMGLNNIRLGCGNEIPVDGEIK